MPPVNVFIGLDAIRVSAEIVPGLPTRAILEEWIAKHDAVDRETEIFDTVELEKLRQLTKGKVCSCSRKCYTTDDPVKLLRTETYLQQILTLLN
jgi:hypothetical protein